MKKITAFLLVSILAVLTACSVNININNKPTEATQAASPTQEETSAQSSAGTLEDYVKTAKEIKSTSPGDGKTITLRTPEVLIDSDDAKEFNREIDNKFGSNLNSNSDFNPIYQLDYIASLNGAILSVAVHGAFEGGNTYGLCGSFDINSGKKLTNADLCTAAGRSYTEVMEKLKENLEKYYNVKYNMLPGNEREKEKTLADDNLSQSELYLEDNNKLVAMVHIYAAVGGGHWMEAIETD